MTTLNPGGTLCVPRDVAVCPYCDGDLIAQPTAWTLDDDGTWFASESGIDCVTEPDLDDDDVSKCERWDEWTDSHSVMPYVYWLPVDLKVVDWLKKNYRWDCKD